MSVYGNVKSQERHSHAASSRTDIFSREDKQRAADMLARHLQWEKNPGDNMVSWTASLLFALVYIFLRASIHNEATLDEIQLLVVDTSSFPKGVFMRDLDLTSDFSSIDRNLQNHKRLRSKQTSGLYYDFGEYLSQGALKIDGRCQIVSARSIINRGLCDIRLEFKEFSNWKQGPEFARWASAVLEMREVFYCDDTERQGISEKGMLAALRISSQLDLISECP
ncbi:uncharacterized protein TRIVIDRAFT_68442 [Trichoderma virens Gv29-8]|uniref:Uncharacterized protein n=1 Tax=Hypocrea virens (strain Gv29-8 / FGSC 10586) TaxID=413071 RepID=G9N496_HYPVG|nr:uncharacterized protein TRIVIDRAFT_68442 [Trichoderma virens Gv29-8]EHK18422.1 hypothetical protein TRIVIDRAFT_68442 [Trichoderma virens Gv29-8]UKZ52633.1 hypothetical protein TrVGV298_006414 [Trichoderma virens]